LRSIYHDLIQLRKQYAALRTDSVMWLRNSDEAKLITFLRGDDHDEFLVVINFSNRPLLGKVDLRNVAGFTPVKINGLDASDAGPLPTFHLNGFEWRIYHRVVVPAK
jgi:glycosidase